MPLALSTAMETASALMTLSMLCCVMSCCCYCVASVIRAADQNALVVANERGGGGAGQPLSHHRLQHDGDEPPNSDNSPAESDTRA
jgi:hypothetical protein